MAEESLVTETAADDRGFLAEIVDALGRHRGWILSLYLAFLAAWIAIFFILGFLAFPEVFHELLGAGGRWNLRDDFTLWQRVAVVAGFLALQALFLWGGGRVRLELKPAKIWKLAVSLVIFSTLMSILTAGLVMSLLEMADRLGTVGTVRLAGSPMEDNALLRLAGVLMMWSWLPWLGVGLLYARNAGHPAVLRRLATTLLAGSWIEFAVALPVDLAIRTRTKECPCASASWITLLFCLPILLWSVGPVLYVLYLRESRLSSERRGHARRILALKSWRSKKSSKGQR